MFEWRGFLLAKKKIQKEGGKPFVIVNVSGLDIPFFGYSKEYLDNVEIGQEVVVLVHEGERNGFPSISGFFIGVPFDGYPHE